MIAIPLIVPVFTLLQLFWFVPLTFAMSWWYADRTWRWTWIVAVECACFGSVWSYSFSEALAQFPTDRLVVGSLWSTAALATALVSVWSRRANGHLADYPGY
jgi:hypothetical protein